MNNHIYIVGAHSRAQTLAEYICSLYPKTVLEAYLVNNGEENPDAVNGVPVIHFDEQSVLCTDNHVFIGTRGIYHQEIMDKLKIIGFQKIYPVTAELDSRIRIEYLEKYFRKRGRKFCRIDQLDVPDDFSAEPVNARIYVAESIFDKKLQSACTLALDEVPIQAGAALAEDRLRSGVLTDDTGDNISLKNRQYCELTVLYWIWKHAEEEIIGLVHYRRHFILPRDWILRMQYHNIDVVLPIPPYAAPNLAENYKKRHDPSDWDYMMEYLRADNEQEYFEAEEFFQKNLYSPCNMFLMRREVLDELCTWLFPILFAVSAHGGQKEDSYLNRYPGFLSERLMTFFFEKHRSRYKAVYSDKNFLA